jgi:hypothetical protein
VSSQLAERGNRAAFLIGKMDLTKVERGKHGGWCACWSRRRRSKARRWRELVGLPSGATAKEVEITKDSKEAVVRSR